VPNAHDIVFLFDLHIDVPADIMDSVRMGYQISPATAEGCLSICYFGKKRPHFSLSRIV